MVHATRPPKICQDCPTEIPGNCKRCKPCAYATRLASNLSRYHTGQASAVRTKQCERCGQDYEPPPTGPSRYCGGACRHEVQLENKRRFRAAHPQPEASVSRPCPTCGKPIPRNGKVYAAFCSDDCKPRCKLGECEEPARKFGWCGSHYQQWYSLGEVREMRWKWSGTGICLACPNPTSGRAKCCSAACYLHLRIYDGNPLSEIICAQCGYGVPVGVVVPGQRRKRRDTKMCRRCRQDLSKYGISIHDLVKRDGPDCRLCGLVVDLTLRAPNPGTPSIDHRTPRAAGGGNAPANLQLAHLYCNIMKSDTLIIQPT